MPSAQADINTMPNKIVLFAPNVHVGGGFVLLESLLSAWTAETPLFAVLDARARSRLHLAENINVLQWVHPTLVSRLHAEWTLRLASAAGDEVLCFHGLPPLLSNAARCTVFLQNRLYFGLTPLSMFSRHTALRLMVERFLSRYLRARVAAYLVQTPSMQADLVQWYTQGNATARQPAVGVLPFVAQLPTSGLEPSRPAPEWDFVYVADGEAHKNHARLLAAWRLLAQRGLRPRLALTLSERNGELALAVQSMNAECGAEVHNLGQMPHAQVLQLYRRSGALIFPSLTESFGLPLLEAQQLGLPILAPELDYVRDVCEPVQTFDALSPQSIARAVQRFLKQPEPGLKILSATDFWQKFLSGR